MKIEISQKKNKIEVIFGSGKSASRQIIGQAESFLPAIDRFLKKSKLSTDSLKNVRLAFRDASLLTERVVRAIMSGLRF